MARATKKPQALPAPDLPPQRWRFVADGRERDMSIRTALDCSNARDYAQQQFADDADINVIMRRFGVSGQLPQPRRLPEYGDFTGLSDYQTALNSLREAQLAFDALPAEVRTRFANDPGQLLEFIHNDDNLEEARKLGLLAPEPVEVPPQRVEIVNPIPPVPPPGDKPA